MSTDVWFIPISLLLMVLGIGLVVTASEYLGRKR